MTASISWSFSIFNLCSWFSWSLRISRMDALRGRQQRPGRPRVTVSRATDDTRDYERNMPLSTISSSSSFRQSLRASVSWLFCLISHGFHATCTSTLLLSKGSLSQHRRKLCA